MKIALIVLLLLTLILLIPVKARFGYDGETALDIKYLFIKKKILPKPPKGEKRAVKPGRRKEPKPAKPKRKFPLTVWDMPELVPKAVDMLLPPVRKLLKRTVIAGFKLDIVVVGSDAADTAVKFGKLNGAVVYAVALLDRIMTFKAKRINIYPGFTFEKSDLRAEGDLKAYPLAVLIAAVQLAVFALILLIPVLIKKKKNKAKAAQIKNDDRKDDSNGKEKPIGRSA